jgi:hypothetical protein
VQGLVTIVGFDNLLDQSVSHNILFVKVDKGNAFNVPKDVLDLNESGHTVIRQIHLRDIPGDDDFRMKAEPRQKHLHLFSRRILSLIQNNE